MSKNVFIGSDDNSAQRIKAAYIGDGNVARRITGGYVGVENTARSFLSTAYSANFTCTNVSNHSAPVSVTLDGAAPRFSGGCGTTATLTGSYLRLTPAASQHVSLYAAHSVNGDNGVYGNKLIASAGYGSSVCFSLSRDSNVYIVRRETPSVVQDEYYYVLVVPQENVTMTTLEYFPIFSPYIRHSADEGDNPTQKHYSDILSPLADTSAATRRTYRLKPRYISDLYSAKSSHTTTGTLYTDASRTTPLTNEFKDVRSFYRAVNTSSPVPYEYKYTTTSGFVPWAETSYAYDVQLRLSFYPGYEYRIEGGAKIPVTSKPQLLETCPICEAAAVPSMEYADAFLSGSVAQTSVCTGNEEGIGYELWYIILGGF